MAPFRVLAIGFLTATVLGAPLAVFAYANPGAPRGFVSDFGEMLAPGEVTELTAKVSLLRASTTAELAVVTVPSLGGDTIENFAVKLFEDWGIGDRKKDNGALLLVSRDDRAVRIEVGYGLEGTLTDAVTNRIIRDKILPNFKNGAYYEGLSEAVGSISTVLNGGELEVPAGNVGDAMSRIPVREWFWLIFFVPIWITSILARSKSWWAGGVLGAIVGVVIGLWNGFLYAGVIAIAVFIPVGLIFDFVVSRAYEKHKSTGGTKIPPWWLGGGGMFGGGSGGMGGGGGFGGFSGGGSGGGGASGRW